MECWRFPTDSGSSGIADDYETALESAPATRGFPPRRSDDLYCVYTGGTTGMPKGVLWRHDDIFFAAMGGGDPLSLGNHIAAPGELAERVLRPGMTALAIPPFIHAAGHWLAFSTLFGGGKIVTLENGIFDPSDVWRLVEVESVNVIAVVGDAMARPLLDVMAAEPDRYDLSSLMAVGSGGALLSPSTKAQLTRLLPGRVVADRFGSSETGQVGGEAPPGDPFGPPQLHVDDRTDVFDGDLNRSGLAPARSGAWQGGATSPLATSAMQPSRQRRSSSRVGSAGRCQETWRRCERWDHHRARARVTVHQHGG